MTNTGSFWSTSMSCKAIRDTSSALRWSPIQVLIVAHCCLTAVMRHSSCYATIHESLETNKKQKYCCALKGSRKCSFKVLHTFCLSNVSSFRLGPIFTVPRVHSNSYLNEFCFRTLSLLLRKFILYVGSVYLQMRT